MADEQTTLNETEVNQIAGGGSSASDHPNVKPDSENIYNTVEDDPGSSPAPDDKAKGGGADAEAAKAAADKAAADEAAKAELDRFDKHPRFQELITGNRELRETVARLEGELTGMRTGPPKPPQEERPAFVDITTKTDEELREWQETDPKGYAANLYAQMRHELTQEHAQMEQANRAQGGIKKTFDDYAAKNPDFMPKWESGELQKYMRDNPGHNAISAHIMITAEKRKGETEAQMNARIAEEVKKAEERVQKNFQAKRRAAVLPGGPAAVPTGGTDTELTDTKQRGGLVSVLTERLNRMRQAS